MDIDYTVVIPLKDEEANVIPLIEEFESVMKGLGKPWELICVEDGSRDSTRERLIALASAKNYLRVVCFDRNYGQSSALDIGFKMARGRFIITMDGDMQNDPADIPRLLALSNGVDLVCGQRIKRRDNLWRHWLSRLANGVRSRFCGDGVGDTGCSLKVYRAAALRRIKMYEGMHRFFPALFLNEGFTLALLPVNHRERQRGKTKYSLFNRSFNTVADMFAVRWMRSRRLHYAVEWTLPDER